MTMPRFRCTVEKGFIPAPGGMRAVTLGQEFEFTGEHVRKKRDRKTKQKGPIVIPPADWMDPVNEEAFALVEGLVEAGLRDSVEATSKSVDLVLRPPKAGVSLSFETQTAPLSAAIERPTPKRRAAKTTE